LCDALYFALADWRSNSDIAADCLVLQVKFTPAAFSPPGFFVRVGA
jgi:hypothetical protein